MSIEAETPDVLPVYIRHHSIANELIHNSENVIPFIRKGEKRKLLSVSQICTLHHVFENTYYLKVQK